MYSYSQDINFLKKISTQKNTELFAQVFLLDINNQIVDNISGKAQNGSINLDGTSSVRRTCSLSILTNEQNFINANWALNSKIEIQIGLKNNTNEYINEKIIWFPMGIYYLTNISTTNSAQSSIINIQGKDKMVKLNGEIGGIFNSTIDFGKIDIYDDKTDTFTRNKINLKTIIKEMIHTYGQEPYEKIFIYDLDDYALNAISYYGEKPIYIFLKEVDDKIKIINYSFDDDLKVYENPPQEISLKDIEDEKFFISKYNLLNEQQNLTAFKINNDSNSDNYYIKKCKYGDKIGYELTDLVYYDELIAAPGENVTSVLNKILNMLGKDNYEYYYDINGNFVFKKQDRFLEINSYLNPYISYINPSISFTSNELVGNISESFDIGNIKNDFTIWGNKNSTDTQFHVRIAIDKKPTQYKSLEIDAEKEQELKKQYPDLYAAEANLKQESICYSVNDKPEDETVEPWEKVDWREIIYQMAQDYKKFNQISDFYQLIESNNPEYSNGITDYERYYIDLDGFWRLLYMPESQQVKIDDELSDNNIYFIDLKDPIKFFDTEEKFPKDTIKRANVVFKSRMTEGQYININSGEVQSTGDAKYYYATTDFIDIEGYKTISFYSPLPYLNNSNGSHVPSYGYCLYDSKQNKKFGESCSTRENQTKDPAYEIKKISVPSGIKYVRFTYWNDIIVSDHSFPELENGNVILVNNKPVYDGYKIETNIPSFCVWTTLDNINYDITPQDLNNEVVYKQIKDDDGVESYTQVGTVNSIIKTNYKILQKMYQASNRDNDKDYLISEDLIDKTSNKFSAGDISLIWLLQNFIDKKNINNKKWFYVKDGNSPEELGEYYDIKTLYKIKAIDNQNYSEEDQNDNRTPEYIQIVDYPKNKYGSSLTNLENLAEDKIGLLLWAQANNQLTYLNKDIDQTTHYNKNIYKNPENLLFWFDFLDSATFSQAHSVATIGPREYVQTKTNATSIINLSNLENIFLNYNKSYTKDEESIKKFFESSFAQLRSSTPIFRLSKADSNLFKISYQPISAMDLIENYIYNYNYMSTSIQLKTISQYYLQPNTLFELVDLKQQKSFQYIINKISYSFGVSANNEMTISGIKLVDENYVKQDLRKEIFYE